MSSVATTYHVPVWSSPHMLFRLSAKLPPLVNRLPQYDVTRLAINGASSIVA